MRYFKRSSLALRVMSRKALQAHIRDLYAMIDAATEAQPAKQTR